MWIFNTVIGKTFDVLFLPFRNMSPWIGMIAISLITGLLMLFIFKYTSNQEGIRTIKNKIKAHLLELRLFQDSLSISLKAQGRILRANFKYIGYAVKPLLVMVIPVALILIQLNFRFAYDSLHPSQKTILRVQLDQDFLLMDTPIDIKTDSGIIVETPPLRILDSHEINWRIRAAENGVHTVTITANGQDYTKKITVGQNNLKSLSPLKTEKKILRELFYPTEPPLPKSSPIKSIEVTYPQRKMNLFGLHIHWLIAYFVLSTLVGFTLKGFFKVEI